MLGQKTMYFVAMALVVCFAGCGGRHKDAELFYQQKDYEKALQVYQEIESQDPNAIAKNKQSDKLYKETKTEVARIYHDRALKAADEGNLSSAVALLEDAQKLDPESADVKSSLESAAAPAPDKSMSEMNWREAIRNFEGTIQADNNNILARARKKDAQGEQAKGEALFDSGMKEFDSGRFSAALGIFEQCKTQDPFHPRIDKALSDARAKVALVKTLFEQAEKQYGLKNWAAAIVSYEKTLEADPGFPNADSRKAQAGEEMKKGDGLFADGQLKASEKRFNMSLALFKQCREQNPSHPEAGKAIKAAEDKLRSIEKLYQEGQAALQKQETEKGVAILEQLLGEVHPYNEKAAVSILDTLSKLSTSLEEKAALGAAIVTIQKARRFSEKFVSEDGSTTPELSQAREKLSASLGRLSNKVYRRTEYEFGAISKDAMSSSVREDMLNQSVLRAITEKPANLKMAAREFSKLPAAERNLDQMEQAARTPNKFILLMEISSTDVQDDRSEVPLQKEYISHYVTEYNPAHSVAKSNYDMQAQNYDSAMRQHKIDSDERSRQMAQQGGLFGAVLGGLAAGVTQPSRGALDQASQVLAQTPQTIQKPVNAMHYYSEVTITKKATVDVYARLAGQNLELAENWQEEAVFSGKYFENAKPEIDIPRVTLRPPQEKMLLEDAFMKLGPKVSASLLEVKKHLIAGYLAEGGEKAKAKDLLPAYESYINAFFIDPATAQEKLLGQPAQIKTDTGLPFDLSVLSQKLEAETGEPAGAGDKLSPWIKLALEKKPKAEEDKEVKPKKTKK